MNPGDKIYYPGERSAATRNKNIKDGIPVDKSIWKKIMELSA